MAARFRDVLVRWWRGGYITMLAGLLAIAAMYVLFGGACASPIPAPLPPVMGSVTIGSVPGYAPEVLTSISGTASPLTGGQQVFRTLAMTSTSGAALLVEVRYLPADSASNIRFSVYQPRNPAGPPPYVFENVALGAFERDIGVTYNVPAPWNQLPSVNLEDLLLVKTPSGNSYYSVLHSTVVRAAHSGELGEEGPTDSPGTVLVPLHGSQGSAAESAAAYSWWKSEFYFGVGQGTSMNTDICQSSVGYVKGGNFFIAVRYPAGGGQDASSAIPGPFRYGEKDHFPRLDLLDETVWPNTAVVSLPLEVAPEWMDFAANELPSAAGEQWVTLAPSSSAPATCPAGLNLASWEFYTYVPIDAGATPADWKEKVLLGYLCFVTGNPPPFIQAAAEALGITDEDLAALGPSVTAMGPFPIRLAGDPPNPPYLVSGPQMAVAKPPGQVQLRFLVENPGTTPLQVTTSVSSRLGLSWGIYRGSFDEPYLSNPVHGAIDLGHGEATPVWVVADVPAGVAGAESVIFTATSASPAGSTWNSGLVWIEGASNLGRKVRRHLHRH